MGKVSLASPQTLNLYAYCGNDPVNRIDPSGLGFFSFLSKIFKSIQKVLKWVAVAVAIAFVVVALVAGPITALALLLKIGSAVLTKLGVLKSVPLIMDFAADGTLIGVTGGYITAGLTGEIIGGLASAGAVASFQKRGQRSSKGRKPKEEPVVLIVLDPETYAELGRLTEKEADQWNREDQKYKECVNQADLIYNTKIATIDMIDEKENQWGLKDYIEHWHDTWDKSIAKAAERVRKRLERQAERDEAAVERNQSIGKCTLPIVPPEARARAR
jgi:hypothetical protein